MTHYCLSIIRNDEAVVSRDVETESYEDLWRKIAVAARWARPKKWPGVRIRVHDASGAVVVSMGLVTASELDGR